MKGALTAELPDPAQMIHFDSFSYKSSYLFHVSRALECLGISANPLLDTRLHSRLLYKIRKSTS